MPQMGSYCKAYPIDQLRAFSGWKENTANLRKEKKDNEENTPETPRVLGPDDYLFVQENFVVTDGIFLDENIVFDEVTPEWKKFCEETLQFEVPDYDSEVEPEASVVTTP